MPEEERRQYRYFFWPESMERGDLLWEASASGLELLHFLEEEGWRGERPPIRFVRWFWRVSQAAPGVGLWGRVMSAAALTSGEISGKRVSVRGVEWKLAYRPWDSKTSDASYRTATHRAINPIPEFESEFDAGVTLEASGTQNEEEMRAWKDWLFDRSLSDTRPTLFWPLIRKIARSEENNG